MEIRQNSKRGAFDEVSSNPIKSTSLAVEDPPVSTSSKRLDSPNRVKVPRLDMSKVQNPAQEGVNKPKFNVKKPDDNVIKDLQPKQNSAVLKGNVQLK